jgi:hypothetical protein
MRKSVTIHSIDAHLVGRRCMSVCLVPQILEEDHSRAPYKNGDEDRFKIWWKLRNREDAFISRWAQKGASMQVCTEEQLYAPTQLNDFEQTLLIFCGELVYQNAKRAVAFERCFGLRAWVEFDESGWDDVSARVLNKFMRSPENTWVLDRLVYLTSTPRSPKKLTVEIGEIQPELGSDIRI